MSGPETESPKVLISYAHDSPEHMDCVLNLANRLRAEGIDCHLDQYETSPPEGWPRWTNRRIEWADYVLVICTETYQRRFKGTEEAGKGLGVKWEGAIITQELYDAEANNQKFIPVLLSRDDINHRPNLLRGATYYDVSSEEGYEELYRRLTNQPRVSKPELGPSRPMPTRERKQFFFSSWNIPYTPNPFFTGREDVLTQLYEALLSTGKAAVSGMPGMGKTQTAIEYANRHQAEYKLILWARADTREALISDYVAIAGTLQLPEVRAPEQNLAVGAVKRWFDANADWLLVLDNADDLVLVREFMPAAPKGRIILTTRAQATGGIASNVEVLKMEEEEGALFLLRRAKILLEGATLESASQTDREKAEELSREVDGLPLALDQAGAFIEESQSSPAEYLELYRTQGAELRSQRGEIIIGHPESVEITFSLSFEKVEAASPTAADLLRACAFLASDAIPEEIFTEGGAHLGDLLAATFNKPLALINAFKEAGRYSLLRRDPDARTLSIHRVVQDVLKDGVDESTKRVWAERIVRAANQVLPDFDETDFSEWYRFERLLPHAQVCAGLIEQWDFTSPEAAKLLNNAARYLHNRGRLKEVEPFYVRALAIREHLHGQDHPDVATSVHNLGWLKVDQGKYAEAELLYLRALNIRKSDLGADNLAVADSFEKMGWLKLKQGKHAEAQGHFNKSLVIRENTLGSDNPKIADSLYGLAVIFINKGNYAEAESLLSRSLAIREKVSGSEHYEVAFILQEQGVIYTKKGKYDKAEGLYLRSHKILEKAFGLDNPNVSQLLNDLALMYWKQNGYAKAEEFFNRAIEIDERVFGAEHPELAITLTNLAGLLTDKRKYVEAEKLFRRAIDIGKKTLPPKHDDLLTRQEQYADLLQRMNRKGEAHMLREHVAKMRGTKGRKKRKR